MKFQEWFDKKLKVTRYPLPAEIKKSGVKYVINVSDEYIASCQEVCIENNIKYFWFPMDEVSGDIGLNSIFGALQILWIAEKENASVILHCHAGANRSPTVMDAYYFLRTKTHLHKPITNEQRKLFNQLFEEELNYSNNRLLNNIDAGHLPSKNKIESFLKQLEAAFLKQDLEKTESNLNTIKFNCRL